MWVVDLRTMLSFCFSYLFDTDSDHSADDGAHAEGGDEETGRDLDAECEDCDDQLEDEGQGQLPHGGVDARSGLGDHHVVVGVGKVPVGVVAQAFLIRDATLAETM